METLQLVTYLYPGNNNVIHGDQNIHIGNNVKVDGSEISRLAIIFELRANKAIVTDFYEVNETPKNDDREQDQKKNFLRE